MKGQRMNRLPEISVHSGAVLRGALLSTLDMLHRRKASEIPDGYIDDYVSIRWMEWHGGGLRLTEYGENVRKQLALEAR
jgi:hypothetical protein